MYAIHLEKKIISVKEQEYIYVYVYTTLVCFAWSTWCLNIMDVHQQSIKTVSVYVKNKTAEIQKLTGSFIPPTNIQVVKCFDFHLFVASGCTVVQSSPIIVVESLQSTFLDAFLAEFETIKTNTWDTSRCCAKLCSQDIILYCETSWGRAFIFITKLMLVPFHMLLAIWG